MTDDPLWPALQAAHNQAMEGKGKERHGGDTPFVEQPIMAIQRMLEGSPVDGHLFQVMKKAQEAGRMAKRGDGEAATRELYGVIVYAAAAVMRLKEIDQRATRGMLLRRGDIKPEGLRPGAVQYVPGNFRAAAEVQQRAKDARAAIDRALEAARLQEPGGTLYVPRGPTLSATEIQKARAAIDRALEELGCQEHEIDSSILRDTMRKQSERDKAYRARQEAINRAGEKLRAGEFKPEDDNG